MRIYSRWSICWNVHAAFLEFLVVLKEVKLLIRERSGYSVYFVPYRE